LETTPPVSVLDSPVRQYKEKSNQDILSSANNIIERLGRASSLLIEGEGKEYGSREYASELVGGRCRVYIKLEQQSEAERATERARLMKELERVKNLFEQTSAKLSNQSFVERAPAQVLEKERDKQQSYASQIEQLSASIAELS